MNFKIRSLEYRLTIVWYNILFVFNNVSKTFKSGEMQFDVLTYIKY
jgi:hypothetical protein